jgi:hypothetical protein
MPKLKSSISKSSTYRRLGEFWDTHDLSKFWDKTKAASFDVVMESETTYYAMDMKLSEEVEKIARKRGIAADTLINLWVQEKLREQKA